jgi:hypothetical protein
LDLVVAQGGMVLMGWMANVPARGLNPAFKPNQRSRVKE